MAPRTATFNDDDFEDLSTIIDASSSPLSSPTPAAGHKRRRVEYEGDTTSEDDRSSEARTPVANSFNSDNTNTEAIILRFLRHKRMRGELITEVQKFMRDIPDVQEAKKFAMMTLINDKLDKQEKNAPPFEVSGSLQKNLDNYAAAILLSPKLSAYKGDRPTNHLVEILKKHRFDLPAGIERNAADWHKVVAAVQESFTQRRSKLKKLLGASVGFRNGQQTVNSKQHQDIFKLAQAFVATTEIKCEITVQMCARIALLRKVYLQDPGQTFWDRVDATLGSIRKQTQMDPKKITRVFRRFLDDDRQKHGSGTTTIQDTATSEVQQEVDDLIEVGSSVDAAAVADDDDDRDEDRDNDNES